MGSSTCDARKLRRLRLTSLHNGLRWPHTILACCVQYWLTALLLVLVEWVERNLGRSCSSGGRRHPAEVHWIKLVEVTAIMELDARSFRSVLRNIRHLLLFCEHLNLHLLLLRK